MGKKVLIVDDAAFMRMILKDILTKNGYEVEGFAFDIQYNFSLGYGGFPDKAEFYVFLHFKNAHSAVFKTI